MFQPNVVNNSTDVFCSQLRFCTCFGQWTRTLPPSFGYLNAMEQTMIHKTDSLFLRMIGDLLALGTGPHLSSQDSLQGAAEAEPERLGCEGLQEEDRSVAWQSN